MKLENDGFIICNDQVASDECNRIIRDLPIVELRKGGVRNLLGHAEIIKLIKSAPIANLVKRLVGLNGNAVKATLFDKAPLSNWGVRWHQDRTICVRDRIEIRGYGPWTSKGNVIHVEPPASVLQEIVAFRIHIDDCDGSNGPLHLIPGTHRLGKLSAHEIDRIVGGANSTEISCRKGAILVMHPLILHASSAAMLASHRRVLHIEFAKRDLIAPLNWHTYVTVY